MSVAKPQVDNVTADSATSADRHDVIEKPFAESNRSNVLAKGKATSSSTDAAAASDVVEKPYAADNNTNFPATGEDAVYERKVTKTQTGPVERPYAADP